MYVPVDNARACLRVEVGRAELDVSWHAPFTPASFSGCSPIQRSAAVLMGGVVIVRHIPFCVFTVVRVLELRKSACTP